MPSVAVHFIDLQKATNDLVMGTHGRGVIIIDDISPLREIDETILSKDLHFFANAPTIINEKSNFAATFGSETQFVGASKTRDIQFKYHLKKRHTFGKMSMEIQDSNGNVVAELSPGKSKGINIVNWNFSKKMPKIAKGKTFTRSGFATHTVAAGKYKVIITKGKNTYEHPFELVYDPNSTLSDAERKLKNGTVEELYDMTQRLAYLVYELDEMIAKATTDKNKKMIQNLSELKKTLVVTTGDGYVGAAPPELRGKMAALYSKIANTYDKPSASDLENLEIISASFEAAQKDFTKLKKKFKNLESLELQSFEKFVNGK